MNLDKEIGNFLREEREVFEKRRKINSPCQEDKEPNREKGEIGSIKTK
jgi:hypothetical protein